MKDLELLYGLTSAGFGNRTGKMLFKIDVKD